MRWIVVASIVATTSAAGAQMVPIRGPLYAPVPSERMLLRKGRLHLAILPGLAVAGAQGTRVAAAARAEVHLLDVLGLGLWGSCGIPCSRTEADLGWASAAQLTLVPAWGKLLVLGASVLRLDLFAFAGAGVVEEAGGPKPAATFGGGMNLYLDEALALAFEARAISSVALVSLGLVLALPTRATRESSLD